MIVNKRLFGYSLVQLVKLLEVGTKTVSHGWKRNNLIRKHILALKHPLTTFVIVFLYDQDLLLYL